MPKISFGKHMKADAGRRADAKQLELNGRLDRILLRTKFVQDAKEIPLEALEQFYILNKGGMRQRFTLWEHQKMILAEINEDIRNKRPVRIVHDKPRREGSSTLFALITYYLVTRMNLQAVLIGHKDFSSQVLYNTIKYAYKYDHTNMRGHAKPVTGKKNKWVMEFEEGGRINIVTAGSKEAATGGTFQILLLTEHALWEGDVGGQMRGLLNTVDEMEPMTFIFIESTGRPATDFQDRWLQAKKKTSAFRAIFTAWFDIKEYKLPFSSQQEWDDFEIGGKYEEVELMTTYPFLTKEQLKWRRYIIDNKCKGMTMESKMVDFHSEYPSCDTESFEGGDAAAFDINKINDMENSLSDPLFTGELLSTVATDFQWADVGYNDEMRQKLFIKTRMGRLRVWEWPQQNVQYCAGADIAEGIELRNLERDNSAMVMRRVDNGLVVLTWRGKLSPDDFADLMECLGLMYNIAYLCPEANNMGMLTTKSLYKSYPRYALYFSKIGADEDEVNRVGYYTSGPNKGPLLTQLAIAMKNNEFHTADVQMLREMKNAVKDSRGKIETHGLDLLMAAALSEEARLDKPNWNRAVVVTASSTEELWNKYKRDMAEEGRLLRVQLKHA